MPWINTSLSARNNFEAVDSKKLFIFTHTLQSSISIGTCTSESTGCEQPLLMPETLLKFCISTLDREF